MEILTVENLSFSYPATGKVLDNISFSLEKGDFLCILGPTGCGKTTLLRSLKKEIRPVGAFEGKMLLEGQDLEKVPARERAARIGYVCQMPEQQLVSDKVWHELAFGLENLGTKPEIIRRRVAEVAEYFGIESLFMSKTDELSGGQKQLVNLAAVMAMEPDILLLDEPTAQLDPIAAESFIETVAKLNRELSVTVIMVEHRLEEVLSKADKLLALENGRVLEMGETRTVLESLKNRERFLPCLPAAVKSFVALEGDGNLPLTLREGRKYITDNYSNSVKKHEKLENLENSENEAAKGELNTPLKKTPALEFSEVYYRYSKEAPDVLNGMSFKVYENEILCLLGGNGSGKSTTVLNASGVLKPYAGDIRVFGEKISKYKNQSLYKNCVAVLPQDVQTVFLYNTVKEELKGTEGLELPFDLTSLLDKHPYDLSGGEQQLVALAKVLAGRPKLLMLDEPTKGLDAFTKSRLTEVIKRIKKSGVTILCVTHDIEFAAAIADRCAFVFRGEVVSCEKAHDFFATNTIYTTAVNRMTRGYYDGITTVEELRAICRRNGRCV